MINQNVLNKFEISAADRERIRKVTEYELSAITSTFNDQLIRQGRIYSCEQVYPIIARFGKADSEIADILEQEFRKFVILTLLKPRIPHAPPGAVDMYWHFFILHTEQYARFCETTWGDFYGDPKYRDHYPSTDETRPGQLRAYLATRRLYVEVFGEPEPYRREGALPVDVWTAESNTSGDSYSGIIDPTEFDQR